jgi:hypothetical protein
MLDLSSMIMDCRTFPNFAGAVAGILTGTVT